MRVYKTLAERKMFTKSVERAVPTKLHKFGITQVAKAVGVVLLRDDLQIDSTADLIARAMVACIFSNRDLLVPATWFDHWKDTHQSSWFVKWFCSPAQHKRYQAEAFFPDVPLAELPYRATGYQFVIHSYTNFPRLEDS